jgi:putative hydrolase of the HAD superfamily
MHSALSHVETWIFDLDNTLYPASANLFGLIDERMALFIQNLLGCDPAEARRVQKRLFRDEGTTLAGLMANHDTDPTAFLDFVHDIALDRIAEDSAVAAALTRLPGRKLIFTNADTAYARRVLEKLGLGQTFCAVHDIAASGYIPKPDPRAYERLCADHRIDPAHAVFVEDMARNLAPAKALGMTTVWINNGSELGNLGHSRDGIDFEATTTADWLAMILEGTPA